MTQTDDAIEEHSLGGLVTARNFVKALRHPVRAVRLLADIAVREWRRLTSQDWEEYYLRTTKIGDEPEGWVGPQELFETMREWQFNSLVDLGCEPQDTVIDLGCGVLRGGIPLIDYLEPGNYYGMDISDRALAEGHRRVREHGLESKEPTLIRNDDLRFAEVDGIEADWLLAQSVWTHLPPERLQECIANMGKALSGSSTVVATIEETDAEKPVEPHPGIRKGVDYRYPVPWLRERAEKHGFSLERLDIDHPNDQQVILLERGP